MKLSAYILELQQLLMDHGDLEVETLNVNFHRFAAPRPRIAYRKILTGLESRPKFFAEGSVLENLRGERVVRV